MKRFKSITFIIAAFIIAAFTSCVRDLDSTARGVTDGMALVTLSLSTPSSPASRAGETSAENAISEIDVLLFDASDNFYYRAAGTKIENQGGEPYATKKFEVKLPISGPAYKIVVLANARAAISTLGPQLPVSTVYTGTARSRASILNALERGLPVGTTNFPMWGYLATTETINENTSSIPDIELTRAVACVDVSVKGGVNFVLTSARLYNYQDAGHVAPEATGSGYNTGATYPAGSKQVGTSKGLGPYNAVTGVISKKIYAFETGTVTLHPTDGWKDSPCLVVGGTYTDASGSSTSYYRIEFKSGDGTGGNPYVALALARNHCYNVVIQSVSGHGYPTPEDAYNNTPANIQVNITEWNDGGMEVVKIDGQHYLSVDRSALTLYTNTLSKTIHAATNYSSGWTIDIPEGFRSWLSVTPGAYDGTSGEALQEITVEASSADGDPGHFFIVVANLWKRIDVARVNELEYAIAILDTLGNPVSELLFEVGDASTSPVKQRFRVEWLPTSIAAVDILEVPGMKPFTYASDSYNFSANTFAAGTSGVVEFTVRPLYNDLSSARVTRVDFSVTDGTRSVMLPLYLRQKKAPTYAFSPDGKTLTLFPNFDRDTNLAGLNSSNIPELQDSDIAAAVTKLVIQGNTPDLTSDQVAGIKNARDRVNNTGLLPYLAHVSLPDFTGTIPEDTFCSDFSTYKGAEWLKSFSAPGATGIGDRAFVGCRNLTAIDFPVAIIIGTYAFMYNTSLTTVNLPVAETIGKYAFSNTSLITVNLPVAETIGEYAFYMCTSLTTVDLPVAETIEGYVFQNCKKLLTVHLPVAEKIDPYTFGGCLALKTVHLPVADTINNYAFYGCTALETVDLPVANYIGNQIFRNCNALTTLKLGYAGTPFYIYQVTSIFGSGNQSKANSIDLQLDLSSTSSRPAEVNGKVWKTLTWKSITQYTPTP